MRRSPGSPVTSTTRSTGAQKGRAEPAVTRIRQRLRPRGIRCGPGHGSTGPVRAIPVGGTSATPAGVPPVSIARQPGGNRPSSAASTRRRSRGVTLARHHVPSLFPGRTTAQHCRAHPSHHVEDGPAGPRGSPRPPGPRPRTRGRTTMVLCRRGHTHSLPRQADPVARSERQEVEDSLYSGGHFLSHPIRSSTSSLTIGGMSGLPGLCIILIAAAACSRYSKFAPAASRRSSKV